MLYFNIFQVVNSSSRHVRTKLKYPVALAMTYRYILSVLSGGGGRANVNITSMYSTDAQVEMAM